MCRVRRADPAVGSPCVTREGGRPLAPPCRLAVFHLGGGTGSCSGTAARSHSTTSGRPRDVTQGRGTAGRAAADGKAPGCPVRGSKVRVALRAGRAAGRGFRRPTGHWRGGGGGRGRNQGWSQASGAAWPSPGRPRRPRWRRAPLRQCLWPVLIYNVKGLGLIHAPLSAEVRHPTSLYTADSRGDEPSAAAIPPLAARRPPRRPAVPSAQAAFRGTSAGGPPVARMNVAVWSGPRGHRGTTGSHPPLPPVLVGDGLVG